jgi:hypothetical protein
VDNRTETNPSGLRVQLSFASGGSDGLASGLGAHLALACDIEVDRLDLVGPAGDQVDEELLHVVKVARLDGGGRPALIAKNLCSAP